MQEDEVNSNGSTPSTASLTLSNEPKPRSNKRAINDFAKKETIIDEDDLSERMARQMNIDLGYDYPPSDADEDTYNLPKQKAGKH
jgi:hypothetical protein